MADPDPSPVEPCTESDAQTPPDQPADPGLAAVSDLTDDERWVPL